MKKLNCAIMIGIVCFALAGCSMSKGSFSSLMSVRMSTPHLWKLSHLSLNGEMTRYITLNEDDIIHFDIKTKKGELSISLVDENNEALYNGTEIPTSTFEVTILKSGTYELTITAKNHKGSFNINWGAASTNAEDNN